jgi:hypothetical protein
MTEGRIALWRYRENRRNYPGYHMTCDATGAGWLKTRLAQLSVQQPLKIALTPVTEKILSVPANWSAAVAFSEWRITIDPSADTLSFAEQHPRCDLALSQEDVADLVKGVSDIAAGKGDYMIGERDQQELWFWWWPAA